MCNVPEGKTVHVNVQYHAKVQMSTNVFEIHMFLSKTHIVSKLQVSWKTPLRLLSFLFFLECIA